jgi:hypothetical protein
MPNDKTTAEKRTTTAVSIPFVVGAEWVKPLSEIPVKFYGELLDFTARRLRAQADFLQSLVGCQNPSDLFKHQAKFFQVTWEEYSKEATKSWKALQDSTTLAPPQV